MQDPLELEGQENLGLATENRLSEIYGSKYRINLDHQILTDHGIFYPQALLNDLVFEVTLVPASQVVKDQAAQNYNQVHPDWQISLPKEPQFSDFHQPSKEQKQGKLLFLAAAHLCSAMPRFVFCELSQS